MAVQRDKVIASAEKLVAKGKIEPAIKEYERLLEDNPNDVNTLNRIGDLWVRINRNDEAVKVFGKIAEHYSKDGFFLKAIAIYKKINKLDPSKLDTYARLADLYAKQGLAMEAKSQYQVLADYYLKHGEAGNALTIYRKISDLDPNSINVHVKLADLYSQNNQPGEALKEYDRVGRMLLKRGMLDEAVQVFRKALKNDPKNTDLVDSLVTALLEAKDYENARQIVETSLEANRENPRLLAMLGKIQLGKGDTTSAQSTLERALAADPNETSVRDALTDLYLRQSNPDRALEMVLPLVEKSMARGERHSAIEQLNRILRVDSGHTPTLERLVASYQRLNEETNVLAAMNSLAEAHIAKMRFDQAAKVLEKLIQQEPQNSQHRTKLQFVRSQMGGVDTMPVGKKVAAPELPPMEIEEPAPSFDLVEEPGPAIEIGLDSSAPLELDFSLEPTAPEAPAPAPAPPATSLRPAVETAAAELEEEEGEDLDFITEHLTEAEVFAKYGLAEKAAEHLRAVLERAPKNLTAHERLLRILLEEGDNEGARAAAEPYLAILDEKDDPAADAVRDELSGRGISVPSRSFSAEPPAAASDSISFEDLAGGTDGIRLEEEAAEIEFEIEPPATAAIAEEEIELTAESTAVEETLEIEELPAEEQPPATAEEEFEILEEQVEIPSLSIEEELPAEEELSVAAELPEEELSVAEELPLEDELAVPEELSVEEELSVAEELPIEEELSFEEELPVAEELPAGEEARDADELLSIEEPLPTMEAELPEEISLPEEETVAGEIALPGELPGVEQPSGFDDLESLDFDMQPAEPVVESPDLVMDEPLGFAEDLSAPLAEEDLAAPPLELGGTEAPPQEESAEPFFGVESLRAPIELEEVPLEEIGEVDFYIEQELFDEARRKLDNLLERFPGNLDLETRRDRIETIAATAAARPPALSRDEIETELLSAIPDDDDEIAPPPPAPPAPAAPAAPAPVISATLAQEENLFADEDNFFDLAAELESELADEEEPIALAEEEQSLEEIFKEFKKGVEQQLDSEDYDTHYNLGIAYKEMGLIDEAIGEFQLASKDPKRAVECSSMLGLCFLEKGMPQLAIKWYRKGLEMPEITEEEHMGLLYDLGAAYQEVGDTQNAQKAFLDVYGINTNYRDVVARIKQLDDARR